MEARGVMEEVGVAEVQGHCIVMEGMGQTVGRVLQVEMVLKVEIWCFPAEVMIF